MLAMRIASFTTTLLVIAILPVVQALWPQPASLRSGTKTIRVNSTVTINLPSYAPHDLRHAANRIVQEIEASEMLALVVDRGAGRKQEVESAPSLYDVQVTLPTDVKSLIDELSQELDLYDESYNLTVPSDGQAATISANSSLGALRGLTTLQQLIFTVPNGPKYIPNTPHQIQDQPAFVYRGLLLDTARNYYPVSDLKHQLDTMSLVKLNQFHWHITDSQSFPLELDGEYAVLAQTGALSPDMTYSRADVQELVTYAAERGININIEIDMPGHEYEGVINFGSKDLLQCASVTNVNEPPAGSLKLNNDKVNAYVQGLIERVAPLFPSTIFSTGGDEVDLSCYGVNSSSEIDASAVKPFTQHAHEIVHKLGKTPMVWEEMALDFPETGKSLRNNTIVETWTTSSNVGKVLESNPGVKLIHAPYDYFYLDCGTTGSWHTGAKGGLRYWCPFVPWNKMYEFDPFNGTDVADRKRILGGEAALWSETVDGPSLDTVIWPRAASAAEVFWTGATYKANDQQLERNLTEAMTRINDIRFRMADRGVAARPVQPLWCALRSGSCLSSKMSTGLNLTM